jgi:hypothetical protein
MATIYSLPRDIVGALMIYPTCELRRTCKWFRDQCHGVFTRERDDPSKDSPIIFHSLWYRCTVPLASSISGPFMWDGIQLHPIPLVLVYQPSYNYVLIPASLTYCREIAIVFCADDELRHFAPLMNCAVYKLRTVVNTRARERFLTPYRRTIPSQLLGGAVLTSEFGFSDNSIMGRIWIQHIDIMQLSTAIRGIDGRSCVYVMESAVE